MKPVFDLFFLCVFSAYQIILFTSYALTGRGVVPIEAVGLIIWWSASNIASDPGWYQLKTISMMTVFCEVFSSVSLEKYWTRRVLTRVFAFQWALLFAVLLLMNMLLNRRNQPLFTRLQHTGNDPFQLELIVPKEQYLAIQKITKRSYTEVKRAEKANRKRTRQATV